MFPNSPIEYLIAFALAFAGGVLIAVYCRNVHKVGREAAAHA
ncbi:hypothetical protein [Burkholderia sp. BCC1638]|nr:hypothetical protein [Burkholderia sp. BCC1638]